MPGADATIIQLQSRKRAATISVAVGLLMLGMKTSGYAITGSAAILSDALESVVHVIATSFALYSVLLSARPADDSHPYGHGKVEFFSAGIEGALILIAAISIIYTAVPKLWNPPTLPDLGIGILLTAVATVVNLVLGTYLVRVGRRTGSLVLVADGKHVLTDAATSLGVVLGLGLVLLTGWNIVDPIVAMIVAVNIVVTGYRLLRESVGGLMHEADFGQLAQVADTLNRKHRPEWIDIHRLRCWKAGDINYLDFHLTLPYYLQVAQAHDIEKDLHETLQGASEKSIQVLIHHDPCVPNCCPFCAVLECPVRQHPLQQQKVFEARELIQPARYTPPPDSPPAAAP